MKKHIYKIFLPVIFFGLFCIVEKSEAALPFSTSFDCEEWQESGAYSCPCDDVCNIMYQPQADHPTTDGHLSLVTSDANNPLGAGKGFRKFFGDDSSILGGNDASGGLFILFGDNATELWMRFYIRVATDFAATSELGHKSIYFYTGTPGGGSAFNYFDVSPGSHNRYRYSKQTGLAQYTSPYPAAVMPVYHDNYIVQGTWQSVELHIRAESGYQIFDGLYELWIDGNLVYSVNNQYHGFYSSPGVLRYMTYVGIPHNTHVSANDPDSWIDYDDIAIYNSTPPNLDAAGNPFIGPLNWGAQQDIVAPDVPSGLVVG